MELSDTQLKWMCATIMIIAICAAASATVQKYIDAKYPKPAVQPTAEASKQ